MEKTLKEMLYDLQIFVCKNIDFARMCGNQPGDALWRISYIQTAGGEQFRFCQLSLARNGYIEGSGIYYRTVEEAEEYAKSIVRDFFSRSGKFYGDRAYEYDWYAESMFKDFL